VTTNDSSTAVTNGPANGLAAAANNSVELANHLKERLIDFAIDHGMKIVAALVILLAGWIVARWVRGVLMQGLQKKEMEPPVRMLIGRIVSLTLLVFTLILALATAGVDVLALVAGVGVAGVGVGLAMQGVLSNVIAGLSIIFTKPFRVGEYVELAGVYGEVKSIELFSTVLLHPDRSSVVIPNRKIVGEILHNYGRIRQLDLSVGVGYRTNIPEALQLLDAILATNSRVLKNPPHVLGVSSLGDSSITIAVRPWVSVSDAGAAGGEIYAAILVQFRERNIEIPFPQREIRMLPNPA
jgi:small conductance mechanosensitive channel